jgi:hypothetical protein
LVECQLPKLDVAGSSPVARSREIFKLLSLTVAGLRVGPGDFFLGPTLGPTLGPPAVGAKALEPLSLSFATAILLGSALIAIGIPAIRASRIQPMAMLRRD